MIYFIFEHETERNKRSFCIYFKEETSAFYMYCCQKENIYLEKLFILYFYIKLKKKKKYQELNIFQEKNEFILFYMHT